MRDLNFVASITERDIDLLLLEELSVSDAFREWLTARLFGSRVYSSAAGAWHSVVAGEQREADLLFIFLDQSGQRIAVLLENKIDAPPQPEQAEGYLVRGKRGEEEGYWDSYITCILAPQKYLNAASKSDGYQQKVSYEELLAYFASRRFLDVRFDYKARIVQEAIEQNRRGYQPVFSEEMTGFVQQYVAYANQFYPELHVQAAKPRPAGSTWITFSPKGLPLNAELCHQTTAGFVKVFFSGAAEQFAALEQRFMPLLSSDQAIALAGKSVSISQEVPRLEPLSQTFVEQQKKVDTALVALRQLLALISKA